MPEAYGRTFPTTPTSSSPREAPRSALEDLRGKGFAFTNPDSNTGKLVPTNLLASMGATPDRFFSRTGS